MLADLIIGAAALPVSFASAYLLLLTLFSRRIERPASRAPHLRFAIVVPAHNEEAGIAATVANLLSVDYPRDAFSVVVVADNCTDGTAARAEAAGARVLVRHDDERRGKGYALLHAFDLLCQPRSRDGADVSAEVDAVVVVDADTVVSP